MDGHRQHAEPAQQCGGGCAGRHAVCGRGERRHQLPELSGAIQPKDQHLGRSRPHEHTQVSQQLEPLLAQVLQTSLSPVTFKTLMHEYKRSHT